jgi:hypothetical protein
MKLPIHPIAIIITTIGIIILAILLSKITLETFTSRIVDDIQYSPVLGTMDLQIADDRKKLDEIFKTENTTQLIGNLLINDPIPIRQRMTTSGRYIDYPSGSKNPLEDKIEYGLKIFDYSDVVI